MRKRWENILVNDFIDNKKWLIMNCTIKEYLNIAWNGGVYRDEPTEQVITEYAEYNDLDINTATKYFNKNCECCGRKIKSKEVLSMNLKVHGRSVNKFYCKKCFMKQHNIDTKTYNNYLQRFKDSGCKLF